MEDRNLLEFCFGAPDKFYKNSDAFLKYLKPSEDELADDFSKQIWEKFELLRQDKEYFTKKINLWNRLNKHIKVI